jgi:hypothetical protein
MGLLLDVCYYYLTKNKRKKEERHNIDLFILIAIGGNPQTLSNKKIGDEISLIIIIGSTDENILIDSQPCLPSRRGRKFVECSIQPQNPFERLSH